MSEVQSATEPANPHIIPSFILRIFLVSVLNRVWPKVIWPSATIISLLFRFTARTVVPCKVLWEFDMLLQLKQKVEKCLEECKLFFVFSTFAIDCFWK